MTHYQERAKGKTQTGTLCKACYHRAVTMQSSQFRTIPGIIDVTRLDRWTGASVGRCHDCDGDAIARQDPDEGAGIEGIDMRPSQRPPIEACFTKRCLT